MSAEDLGGVVPVWEGVHHAGGALCAAVAGVGAEGGEREAVQAVEFACCGFDHRGEFEVSGVETEGYRGAVFFSESAGGCEDDELLTHQFGGIPPHTGVLGHAEVVTAGAVREEIGREWQDTCGPVRAGADLSEFGWLIGAEDVLGSEF